MTSQMVLTTVGSAGDVLPLIALGTALRDRGHRVTLAVNPHFAPQVEAAGLELVPIGSAEDFERAMDDPALWSLTRAFGFVARTAVVPSMRPLYEYLSDLDPTRTVVAGSVFAFGARLAQERLGFPLVTLHLQPTSFLSADDNAELGPVRSPEWVPRGVNAGRLALVDRWVCDPVLAPELNRLRAELGLPPVRHVFGRWAPSPTQNLGLFPDWYTPIQPDWPAHMHLAGFIPAGVETPALPDDVERFLAAGEAPVVATFGSAMRHARSVFDAIVRAARSSGRRVVLLTRFGEQVPAELSEGALHVPWVSLAALLPRAAAVVHHGGIGTVAQGLRAGVPQLVMPFAHDQPDNANRLIRLGVGARLDPRRVRPGTVARALDTLDDPHVLDRCTRYAARCDPAAAVADAAHVIETTAR